MTAGQEEKLVRDHAKIIGGMADKADPFTRRK